MGSEEIDDLLLAGKMISYSTFESICEYVNANAIKYLFSGNYILKSIFQAIIPCLLIINLADNNITNNIYDFIVVSFAYGLVVFNKNIYMAFAKSALIYQTHVTGNLSKKNIFKSNSLPDPNSMKKVGMLAYGCLIVFNLLSTV